MSETKPAVLTQKDIEITRMEKAFQLIYNDKQDAITDKQDDKDLQLQLQVLQDKIQDLQDDIVLIREALTDYMEGGYIKINSDLYLGAQLDPHKPSREVPEKTQKKTTAILKSMELFRPFRAKRSIIVYRGISGISDQEYCPLILPMMRKDKYMNRSYFTSTSICKEKSLAFADCCLLEIHIYPEDNIDYIWLSAKGEREILIERYTYLRCIKESVIDYEERKIPMFTCILKKGNAVPLSKLKGYYKKIPIFSLNAAPLLSNLDFYDLPPLYFKTSKKGLKTSKKSLKKSSKKSLKKLSKKSLKKLSKKSFTKKFKS
jgi:hypothetical protein